MNKEKTIKLHEELNYYFNHRLPYKPHGGHTFQIRFIKFVADWMNGQTEYKCDLSEMPEKLVKKLKKVQKMVKCIRVRNTFETYQTVVNLGSWDDIQINEEAFEQHCRQCVRDDDWILQDATEVDPVTFEPVEEDE